MRVKLSTSVRNYVNVFFCGRGRTLAKALGTCRLPLCFFRHQESNVPQPKEHCSTDQASTFDSWCRKKQTARSAALRAAEAGKSQAPLRADLLVCCRRPSAFVGVR
jgi:hypothetical protein